MLALALAYWQVASYRQRRLLYAAWRRTVRWEYWPLWAFYLPVVLYVLALSLRHRGLTLVSVVNPGLDRGGVALVSKSVLLKRLAREPGRVAPFVLIPPQADSGRKRAMLAALMAEHGLSYPIVLKPDLGERGRAVRIVADEAEALAVLDRCSEPMLAQQYVSGREYGVYYMRHPAEARGRILALTAKDAAYVIGDGTRTLERLILDDPRLVCYGRLLLGEFADRLGEVVPAGERFVLTELRSHWRGAQFSDVEELRTPQLEQAFLDLARHLDGFFVGRYDVRAPSPRTMRSGDGFKVIELNSVMSEPIHMYDARYGVLDAYRIMFGLWRRIIAIGAENRARGARPLGPAAFARLILDYRAHRRAQS